MKIRVWVKTNKVGSKCERVVSIHDEDLADLTQAEREAFIKDAAGQQMMEMVEWGYEELLQ